MYMYSVCVCDESSDVLCSCSCLCRQCWECLAEAYLARGSHMSALKAFSKVVEVQMYMYMYNNMYTIMYMYM